MMKNYLTISLLVLGLSELGVLAAAEKEPASKPAVMSPEELFAKTSPAVVRVVVRDKDSKVISFGSGFFISADGLLITNYHVIKDAKFASVLLSNNATLFVDGVAATDAKADLALLKVNGKDLPHLTIAGEKPPKVGAKVYAIGNPQGLTNTLSEGMVSGLRKIKDGLSLIQTTAPISKGSSGGPLLTLNGKVVGVTSAYLAGGQNLNFAVPAEKIAALLKKRGKLQTLASAGGGRLEPSGTDALAARVLQLQTIAAELAKARKIMTDANPRIASLKEKIDERAAPLIKDLRAKIDDLKAAKAKLPADYKETHPQHLALTQQIAGYEMALNMEPLVWFGDLAKTLTLNLGGNATLKLALIPAGRFQMGSPAQEQTDIIAAFKGTGHSPGVSKEGPQHEVTISKAFYMGVYAVTQEQYAAIAGTNPSYFKGKTNPVEKVSWDDATDFCKKLSKKTNKTVRLPTEAQWEHACRAGSKTRFYYGDDEDYSKLVDYAWYDRNSDKKVHPVGQKKPNAWGLYDMHGNVFQWCADWWADYPKVAKADPSGSPSGSYRVIRGGAYVYGPVNCRSASRNCRSPQRGKSSYVGFRVVIELRENRDTTPATSNPAVPVLKATLTQEQEGEYVKLMNAGLAALIREQWRLAREQFEKARKIRVTDEVRQAISETHYRENFARGKEAFEQGDFRIASAYLNLAKSHKDTPEVRSLIAQAREKLR